MVVTMVDVIDFQEFKKRKEQKHKEEWEQYMRENPYFIADICSIRADKYQLALEKQRSEDYYLAKFFFPDYDW